MGKKQKNQPFPRELLSEPYPAAGTAGKAEADFLLGVSANTVVQGFIGLGTLTDSLKRLSVPQDKIDAALANDVPILIGSDSRPTSDALDHQPPFLDCVLDRDKRSITRLGKTADFSKADVAWRFLVMLHDAGVGGISRDRLLRTVWTEPVAGNNLSQQKTVVLRKCLRLYLTINTDKGIWDLAAIPDPKRVVKST